MPEGRCGRHDRHDWTRCDIDSLYRTIGPQPEQGACCHPPSLRTFRFKNRPARNKGFEDTGYSYNRSEGFEPLGYRLVDTVRAEPRWLVHPPWISPNNPEFYAQILVYRRDTGR